MLLTLSFLLAPTLLPIVWDCLTLKYLCSFTSAIENRRFGSSVSNFLIKSLVGASKLPYHLILQFTIFSVIVFKLVSKKGVMPVLNSYSSTPKLHRSAR